MWIYGWIPLGGTALILALVNLLRGAMGKNCGWRALLSASLSCGGLAVVCALLTVNEYVQQWLADSLLDAAPALTVLSSWGVCLGIVLNLSALWLHTRREKNGKEME